MAFIRVGFGGRRLCVAVWSPRSSVSGGPAALRGRRASSFVRLLLLSLRLVGWAPRALVRPPAALPWATAVSGGLPASRGSCGLWWPLVWRLACCPVSDCHWLGSLGMDGRRARSSCVVVGWRRPGRACRLALPWASSLLGRLGSALLLSACLVCARCESRGMGLPRVLARALMREWLGVVLDVMGVWVDRGKQLTID